jgi:dihydroflavonol-4-reductase
MILVTGAAGHIGNVLVRELIQNGMKVRTLILPGEDTTSLDGFDIECIEGNVLSLDSLRYAFQGVEKVYHLAGIVSIMPGKDDLVHRVNVDGTRNVIQVAQETQVKRLIYTSSIHAIKRIPQGKTIDETVPFDPDHAISEYDRSKAEASIYISDATKHGLDAVIVCPTGVIGPYDYRNSEMGSIFTDCLQLPVMYYIDGAYDFVDVRDVAKGLLQASEHGKNGEVYILSGERITVFNLVKQALTFARRKVPVMKVPTPIARATAMLAPIYYRITHSIPRLTSYAIDTLESNSYISHHKATRELEYQPRSIKNTIADTIQWLTQQRIAR